VGHVAHMGDTRNAYKHLVGKSEGNCRLDPSGSGYGPGMKNHWVL